MNLIKNLNLYSVKAKLGEKKGFWWRVRHSLDKLEAEYRQFLYLAATHPTEVVVPWSQHLDDFWHEHILDTAKYEVDCMAIFGKMFHHNPHLPIGSKDQVKAFNKTKEMYKESFGEKAAAKSDSSHYFDPGCGGIFTPVFCAGHSHAEHSPSSHDGGHDSGSHSSHDSGHSDSGGHSCGGHSCGGGSSCGGGGCGGGGGD